MLTSFFNEDMFTRSYVFADGIMMSSKGYCRLFPSNPVISVFLVVSYSFWLWQLDHALFDQVSER